MTENYKVKAVEKPTKYRLQVAAMWSVLELIVDEFKADPRATLECFDGRLVRLAIELINGRGAE